MLKQWEIAGGEIVKSKVYSHHRFVFEIFLYELYTITGRQLFKFLFTNSIRSALFPVQDLVHMLISIHKHRCYMSGFLPHGFIT